MDDMERAQAQENGENQKAEEEKSDIREEAEKLLDSLTSGVMNLRRPIRARGQDVTELKYDFARLTGTDYTRAMNSDRANRDAMSPSSTQLLALFAAAAADREAGYDERDITSQIGIFDVPVAVGIANNFFRLSVSVGAARISKKP